MKKRFAIVNSSTSCYSQSHSHSPQPHSPTSTPTNTQKHVQIWKKVEMEGLVFSEYRIQDIFKFFMKDKHVKLASNRLFDLLEPALTAVDGNSSGVSGEVELDNLEFQMAIDRVLQEFSYAQQLFHIATSIKLNKSCIIILLGGTSGCGKSTLGSLLASRLGISTVISTDNIRQLLRSFLTDDPNHILLASSYDTRAYSTNTSDIIAGYEMQNECLFDNLNHLLQTSNQPTSLIVEGVHLSVKMMVRLMQANPTAIIFPFIIYISNRMKHCERFAIRAKYMTLDPCMNKYVKYFDNIRSIQEYLCSSCRLSDSDISIPKIDNTNVDKSIALIHQTILRYLTANSDRMDLQQLDSAFDHVLHSNNRGSKEMLDIIHQRKQQLQKRHTWTNSLQVDDGMGDDYDDEDHSMSPPLSANTCSSCGCDDSLMGDADLDNPTSEDLMENIFMGSLESIHDYYQ